MKAKARKKTRKRDSEKMSLRGGYRKLREEQEAALDNYLARLRQAILRDVVDVLQKHL